jgi:hypothetical protein
MRVLATGLTVAVILMTISSANGRQSGADMIEFTDFIATAAPVYKPLAELRGQERFPEGAQLLLVHDGKAEPLMNSFAASADANVSFDGQTVLFAGKQFSGDPWQIWELTLKDRTVRRITATATDAERPFYLPGGRIVWAQRTAKGFQLQSSDDGRPIPKFLNPTAGPGILPLTYAGTNAFPADVLHDGRILFEAGFPLGTGTTPEIFLVYADGSGVESVRCDHGRARWGGTQLASGDVVFTHGTSLGRFTSAMAREEPIHAPHSEYAGAIAETPQGDWLMSARPGAGARFAIKLWTPGSATMRTVLARSGEDLVEPVLDAPRPRPNRHPSGLHPWDYANLMALDARVSRDGDLKGKPASVRLEAQDAAGRAVALGTAPIEQDGSFFVRVPVDKPIRFELLDFTGTILRQERGWFWARGGEQRICVGCHAGPERASVNRVPDVLMHTTEPVDLTGAKTVSGASRGN